MIRIASHLAGLCLVSTLLFAVETQTWRQSSEEDFAKGSRERIALRSDGLLTLAPELKERFDTSSDAAWALAADSKGNLYTSAAAPEGGKLRVYRIPAGGGTPETLADVEGLACFAIAVDARDRVYVAVSPESKIYRVSTGTAELVYSLDVPYIWAMAFDSSGNLYAATGDKGAVYRIAPDGTGSTFFETEETHVRSLLVDEKDNLIVGTAPSGLVMRISPARDGFVLYQSEKEEVTALALDDSGAIYAASVGNKRPTGLRPTTVPVSPPAPAPAASASSSTQPGSPQPQSTPRPATSPLPRAVLSGGSELIRLGSDGFPKTVWESPTAIVYALAFGADKKVYLGTGNEAALYRLEERGLSTSLLNAQAEQITAVLALKGGGVAFSTANVGKVLQAGPALAQNGHFESDVFDSEFFARWGRISIEGEATGDSLKLKARSGNVNRPQKNWSDWSEPVDGTGPEKSVDIPAARFLQWRAELARNGGDSPELRAVEVAYRNRNVPPRILEVEATPPNYTFPPRVLSVALSDKLTLSPLSGRNRARSAPLTPSPAGALSMNYAKGFVGVRWLAEDENQDELTYQLEIRPVGNANWMPLAKELEEPQYSWDSKSWPDGHYEVRVTVSDRKANVPDEALESSELSGPFLIDNSEPRVENLAAAWNGNILSVTWSAADERSPVRSAQYSLNGKDWTRVEPQNGLSDARTLRYSLDLSNGVIPGSVIAVKVTDEFANETVSSVLVPGK